MMSANAIDALWAGDDIGGSHIRASAVLGIVGAGGIGNLINEFRRFFQYDALMVVVIEILVLVIIVEWISIWLRRRLV